MAQRKKPSPSGDTITAKLPPPVEAQDADEFDLPPEGFVFFLIAQQAKDKISEADAHAKVKAYISSKIGNNRDGERGLREMSNFLGRVVSVSTNLIPLLRR